MSPLIRSLADASPQPWRNGHGVTREFLAFPPGDAWTIRVSIADITASAPFSALPGVERWFAIVGEDGVTLTIDETNLDVVPCGEVARFEGGSQTHCTLKGGPTRALNLMLRGIRGSLGRLGENVTVRPAMRSCGVFATARGQCRFDGREIRVEAGSLVWFAPGPPLLELAFPPRTGWYIEANQ